jgi:hypothetical protein
MQVGDAFPSVWTVVDDDTETFSKTLIGSQLSSYQQQVSEQGLIGHLGLGNSRQGLLGNDQQVDRCLGISVLESDD